MNGSELLQAFHSPELEHRLLPSSEWEVRVFRSVIRPSFGNLAASISDLVHRGFIAAQSIRHDDLG